MESEPRIREIISSFIHKDVAEITAETAIDRSAVGSSIHVHRMYAALAEAGLVVANPNVIRTFGDLQLAAGIKPEPSSAAAAIPETGSSDAPFIGIDIEEIANFSIVADFREDQFYQQNFSPSEIAWCIVQPQPLASFAGKFAAKEAIVKADNRFKSTPFRQIEILNSPGGRPQFMGFEISISHTASMAVAVAIKGRGGAREELPVRSEVPGRNKLLWLVTIAALLLALAALLKG